MEILFLGTGAADWPAETGSQGDERGLDRRRTSVLVDGEILIDPGPDVPEALQTFGADHLARHYYPDIETARAAFAPMGAVAAYDGLRLNV